MEAFRKTYVLAEGPRGAQHIAHRLAMTPAGKSQAICGARVLSVNLASLAYAPAGVIGATCDGCIREAWAGHGNEEGRI